MAERTEDILAEVKERFEAAEAFEANWRAHALDDLRFFHADAYNHYQWDDAVYQARSGTFGGSPRPCLTINKTAQHVLQVENDARQSQMGIKVNATGFGSTAKAADVIEGIIRHIEYQSNAQQNAYMCAIQGQVRQGMGWFHIVTDYVRGADTFDQDFYIKSVPDPRSVYSDPNTQEPDHSDMQWAMIVEEMPKAEFERLYPAHKDVSGAPLSIAGNTDYRGQEAGKDVVRVFRYYRRSERRDTLWAVPVPQQDGSTVVQPMRQSVMPDEAVEYCRSMQARSRPITRPHVEFFLIAGDGIVSSGDTVFMHIPLVPVVGMPSVIDGKLDRSGLVRALLDPQRMYNYSASASVESVALQTKSPWLVDERAIEGYESQWANANVSNAAYLPYRSTDPDDGTTPIAPPQRLDPATGSTGHIGLMQASDAQMQMVTGQYQAEMGAPGNEKSGRAINERQRQSDTANYHYTDNQGMALRLAGRILIDAIPYVYDTQRAVQVMGADGTQTSAVVDPQAAQAAQVVLPPGQQVQPGMTFEQQAAIEGAIIAINPTVGRYDVEADVGPSFATRRQDAFDFLSRILPSLPPDTINRIIDLVFKAADFPLADEIWDRLKPASDDPRLGEAQQQIQQLQGIIQQLQQKLGDKSRDFDLRADKQRHEQITDLMDAQTRNDKAETDRMAALGSIAPEELRPVLAALVREVLQEQGYHGPASQPEAPPGELDRLPTTNPPGGLIHAPDPVNGAVDV